MLASESLTLAHPLSCLTVVGVIFALWALCMLWSKGLEGLFTIYTIAIMGAVFFYSGITSDPAEHNSRGPHPYDRMYRMEGPWKTEWVSEHDLLYKYDIDPPDPEDQQPTLRRDIGGRAIFFHPGCFLWVAFFATPIYGLMFMAGLTPLTRGWWRL